MKKMETLNEKVNKSDGGTDQVIEIRIYKP